MTANIGEIVRSLRSRHGLTRADLAARSGLSERQLARIEAGKSTPKIGTIASLAAAFDLDAAHLMISPTNEELTDIVDENTCQTCRAPLVSRAPVQFEYGDADLDLFECGATRGWRDRPCPKDPRFPAFEDYELVFHENQDGCLCLARGLTEAARSVDLYHGKGKTREIAKRWIERAYIEAKYGHAEAEKRHPHWELMELSHSES